MLVIFVGAFPSQCRIKNNIITTITAQIVVARLPRVLKTTIEITVRRIENIMTNVIPFLLVISAAKSSFPCEISSVLRCVVDGAGFLPFAGVDILIDLYNQFVFNLLNHFIRKNSNMSARSTFKSILCIFFIVYLLKNQHSILL